MKKITIILLFLFILFLVGCNSISEQKLEEKSIDFLELYFDDSILDFGETCLLFEDDLDSDFSVIRDYYVDNFTEYLTDSELARFTDQIGVYEMSRMVIESSCYGDEIIIRDIKVSLKDNLTQDENTVEFELYLRYKDLEFDKLYGEIKFNSEQKIERFHIIGTK